MRVVVALGGNALLRRDEAMTPANQRRNIRAAVPGLAAVARDHELVLSHGNGPQVGLLALEAADSRDVAPAPLDVLGAQTEGMIGYVLEQELGNVLAPDVPLATVLTMVEVDPDDPAFTTPTKFVGAGYDRGVADRLAADHGWSFALDGDRWRRVVASPEPRRIVELRPISWLVECGVLVICSGGGGIPTAYAPGGSVLMGVEAVIDKDLAGGLLAADIGADVFVMATDVDAVHVDWGTADQRPLGKVTPADLRTLDLPAGSMGPKAEAACRFVEATGGRAAIGALDRVEALVAGTAGTQVVSRHRR